MKIHITKKEYRKILDILAISEWVMNAHKYNEDKRCSPYKEIEQKLLSYAKQFGCDDIIQYDKSLKAYYPTRDFEENETSKEFIDEFVEETFWDELSSRLAMRDFVRNNERQLIEEMDPMEQMIKIGEYEEKYTDEFHKNGLENISIKKEI